MYVKGTEISLTAIPKEGYLFAGFYVMDKLVHSELNYTFNIIEDIFIDLKFVRDTSKDYYYQSYSHVLVAEDIPDLSGGTTADINGLKWSYGAHNYKQNSTKGVQIGSSNRPQTSTFELKATLPKGVFITSTFVEVAVASGGTSTFIIEFGGTQKTSKFTSTSIEMYSYEDFEVETLSISFKFKATAKALYIYSFGFTAKIKSNVNLNLSGDTAQEAQPIVPGENKIPSINYQPVSKETYYKDIDTTAKGTTLLASLRSLISTMTATSYDQAKYMLQYTDENPENSGYVYGMYDGDNIIATWNAGTTWNREHVWPCAKMVLDGNMRPSASTKNHTSDLHNLRAACPTVNGFHADKYYSTENTATTMFPNITSGIDGKHAFTGDFRGDVARIMFYMYTRYDGLELTDDIVSSSSVSMGKLSLFLEWNKADPVDAFEAQRNDRIYAYQGNRNPFIDYPELANNLFA